MTGLTWGFFHLFVVGWLCLLVIGAVILRDVWRPARIMPGRPETRTPGPVAAFPPEGDQPPVVVLIRPWAAAGVAALVIFLVGGETTKIAVIMLTTLVGAFAFFRGFVR